MGKSEGKTMRKKIVVVFVTVFMKGETHETSRASLD